MSLLDAFHSWILETAKRFGIDCGCDPHREYLLVQLTSLAIFMMVISIPLILLQKIKDPEKRTRIMFGLLIAIVNTIAIVTSVRDDKFEIDQARLLSLVAINIFLFGIFSIRGKLNNFEIAQDYGVKHTKQKSSFGNSSCPACGKRTISYFAAVHAPQTCSNCGKRFRADTKNKTRIYVLSILASGIFIPSLLHVVGAITRAAASTLTLISIICMLVYALRPGKLIEETN